jgi:hypothetical protein
LAGYRIDLAQLIATGCVEQDALIEVTTQQASNLLCSIGGKQVCAHVLGANGVSFFLFQVLALIVTSAGHGKGEGDD